MELGEGGECVKLLDSVRKFFSFEKRRVVELNKDDEKLLEWLGISPSDVNVKGKKRSQSCYSLCLYQNTI